MYLLRNIRNPADILVDPGGYGDCWHLDSTLRLLALSTASYCHVTIHRTTWGSSSASQHGGTPELENNWAVPRGASRGVASAQREYLCSRASSLPYPLSPYLSQCLSFHLRLGSAVHHSLPWHLTMSISLPLWLCRPPKKALGGPTAQRISCSLLGIAYLPQSSSCFGRMMSGESIHQAVVAGLRVTTRSARLEYPANLLV